MIDGTVHSRRVGPRFELPCDNESVENFRNLVGTDGTLNASSDVS